jgi:hypothetical protein
MVLEEGKRRIFSPEAEDQNDSAHDQRKPVQDEGGAEGLMRTMIFVSMVVGFGLIISLNLIKIGKELATTPKNAGATFAAMMINVAFLLGTIYLFANPGE